MKYKIVFDTSTDRHSTRRLSIIRDAHLLTVAIDRIQKDGGVIFEVVRAA